MTGTSGVPGETSCGQLPYALLSMGAMKTVLKQQLLADRARLRARLQSQAQSQTAQPDSEPDYTARLRARLLQNKHKCTHRDFAYSRDAAVGLPGCDRWQ